MLKDGVIFKNTLKNRIIKGGNLLNRLPQSILKNYIPKPALAPPERKIAAILDF